MSADVRDERPPSRPDWLVRVFWLLLVITYTCGIFVTANGGIFGLPGWIAGPILFSLLCAGALTSLLVILRRKDWRPCGVAALIVILVMLAGSYFDGFQDYLILLLFARGSH